MAPSDLPSIGPDMHKRSALHPNAFVIIGHISRDCTAPNGGPLNSAGKVCYKCGQAGHISRDCAATETNGAMALDGSGDPVPPAATTAVV
ncbi:MAG: hypothetical protein Q9217_000025 [Psora testacea]